MHRGVIAFLCVGVVGAAGIAPAWGQDPAERGGLVSIRISLTPDRLKLDYAAGIDGLEVPVDYDPVTDEWVVTGSRVVAGTGCVEGPPDEVRCPEDGQDVTVNFNDSPASRVTLAPADDDLNFDSRVRLGFNNQSIVTSNGTDVVTSDETVPSASSGDLISTLGGSDEIRAGTSPDVIFAGEGDDTIDGGGGGDFLEGGAEGGTGPDGADSFTGGEGEDEVEYSTRTDDVSATIGGAGGAPGEGDTIADDIENLTGGLGNDRLTGDGDANVLRGGGDGDDVLFGGSGDGPDGADLFRVGSNVSTNVDAVSYANRADAITADIGGGADDIDGDDISADADNLVGGQAGDLLTGDDDANTIVGGKGQDTMLALGGPDTINALDDGPDTSDCGDGVDMVRTDVAQTEVVTSCETTDTAPETVITVRPEPTITAPRARFRFESTTPGLTGFECSFDGSVFSACASPQIYTGLSLGRHRFAVRAIDADGDADISPAKAKFRRVAG